MNVADSETVASIMKMAGYETCDKEEDADAVFINTCSVRDNAEQKMHVGETVANSSSAYWAVWQKEQKTNSSDTTTLTLWLAPIPT